MFQKSLIFHPFMRVRGFRQGSGFEAMASPLREIWQVIRPSSPELSSRKPWRTKVSIVKPPNVINPPSTYSGIPGEFGHSADKTN